MAFIPMILGRKSDVEGDSAIVVDRQDIKRKIV